MPGKGVSSAGPLLLALILSWFTPSSAQYTPKTAVMNHNVALTCNTFCQGPRTWEDGDGHLVAYCVRDDCKYSNGYEHIKMSNDSKDGNRSLDLFFFPVQFNDKGFYRGFCDEHQQKKDKHCVYKLQTLVPQTVTGYTGQNSTLPCHAVTKKNEKDQNIFILWDKNGEMGVQLNGTNFTHGVIPKDRGLISKDGYKTGDLSLPLSFVRPSDAGLYQCHCSPRRDTDKCPVAPNSVEFKVLASTFQVPDDSPVMTPVVSGGPVAVTFRGHDGGPEDDVCTLSEGQPQCAPQHGGMFAVQDATLTFTRGSSTHGGVYFLKDKDSGDVLYIFNVTMATKESSWICWGTALGIILLLSPAQVISCILHQDLATLIRSLYTWLIEQVRRRCRNSEEVTPSPVPQSEEEEGEEEEEEEVKISVQVSEELEKITSSTCRIEE